MKSSRSSIFAIALALVCSCHSLPERPGGKVETLVEGRLVERNPADIAVLPIVDRTGRNDVPLPVLRRAFYEGLVERRYSPLSLDFVDRRAVDASFSPGMFGEEAALKIYLTEWDDSNWETHKRIRIAADVYVLDSRPTDANQELWGGTLEQDINVSAEAAKYALDRDLIQVAVSRFATEILGNLPLRDPLALPSAE